MIATERSPEVARLIDLLKQTPVGDVLSLGRLSKAVGRDIGRCRHLLYSAIRIVQADCGATWASVRGEGYRRMKSEELPSIGRTARDKIRRSARRGVKTMEAGITATNELPNEVRLKVLREQSVLSMIEHVARERNLPRVGEADTRPLPVAVTGRQFLQSIGALSDS